MIKNEIFAAIESSKVVSYEERNRSYGWHAPQPVQILAYSVARKHDPNFGRYDQPAATSEEDFVPTKFKSNTPNILVRFLDRKANQLALVASRHLHNVDPTEEAAKREADKIEYERQVAAQKVETARRVADAERVIDLLGLGLDPNTPPHPAGWAPYNPLAGADSYGALTITIEGVEKLLASLTVEATS